jgi:hypothetical protein
MRMNAMRRKRRGAGISLWAFGAVALCGAMPDAVASDLVHAMSGVWAPAAALSLTLITAVMGSQR